MAEANSKKVSLPPSSGKVDTETEKYYGNIDMSAVKFHHTWSVWESLKYDVRDKVGQSMAFIDNNFELFEFNNMEQLAKIWRSRIGNVSSLLSLDGQLVKFKDSNNRFRTIEAICLFKKGIQPAWEDKMNAQGGELQAVLDIFDYKPEVIDRIFKEITTTILSDNYPFAEETNGVRLVDKSRGKVKVRLEFWLNFDQEKSNPETFAKSKKIEEIFKAILARNGYPVSLEFKSHRH